jgi:hypothetical protein
MNLNPGLSPEEYTTKALRSMGFMMESLLDDPCVRRAVPSACFCDILLSYVQVNGMAVFENFAGFSLSSATKMKALIPDELQKLQMGCLKVPASTPLSAASCT